jgi:hypothetical protein
MCDIFQQFTMNKKEVQKQIVQASTNVKIGTRYMHGKALFVALFREKTRLKLGKMSSTADTLL